METSFGFPVKLALFVGITLLLTVGPAFFVYIPQILKGVKQVSEVLLRIVLLMVLAVAVAILVFGILFK